MNKKQEKKSRDSVLKEIHCIQEKHYKERKSLPWEKQKEIIDKSVSELEKEYKIKFKLIQSKDIFALN